MPEETIIWLTLSIGTVVSGLMAYRAYSRGRPEAIDLTCADSYAITEDQVEVRVSTMSRDLSKLIGVAGIYRVKIPSIGWKTLRVVAMERNRNNDYKITFIDPLTWEKKVDQFKQVNRG